MSCDVSVVNAGPMPVWSNREDAPDVGVFIHLTGFQETGDIERVRATLELRSNSGHAEVAVGYQVANEATDPGQAYAVTGNYVTADGIDYGTSFTDISTNLASKQLVRFGVFVRNTAAATGHTELVLATLRIELQARA